MYRDWSPHDCDKALDRLHEAAVNMSGRELLHALDLGDAIIEAQRTLSAGGSPDDFVRKHLADLVDPAA